MNNVNQLEREDKALGEEPVREIDELMLAEALAETSIGTAGAVQVEYGMAFTW